MLDAIELERLGIPSASIHTEPFRGSVSGMATTQGISDYPAAWMSHPVAGLDEAALRERVARFIDQVARQLQEQE